MMPAHAGLPSWYGLAALSSTHEDGWRDNALKTRKVRLAIRWVLATVVPAGASQQARMQGAPTTLDLETETDRILDIARHHSGY